jgi:phosphoribosylamine-glycine ligase
MNDPSNDPVYIVKTDGKAAGKGVLVTESWDEAAQAIKAYLRMGSVIVERVRPPNPPHDEGGER